MEMPKVTDEHRKLYVLLGDWEGEETLSPSPWGPGGPAIGRHSFRLELDGFYVVQDYVEEKDGKVSFRGHGIFGYDTLGKEYTWHWFDNMGFVPGGPSRGTWEGDTLTLQLTTPRGKARYTYRFEGDSKYHFRIDNSFDGGATYVTFIEGTYSKKA